MRRALAALAAMLIVLAPSLACAACPCPCMHPAPGGACGEPPHACCGGAPGHGSEPSPEPARDAPNERCECSDAPTFTVERGVDFDPSLRATAFAGPAPATVAIPAPSAPAPSGLAGDSSHVPRCGSSSTPASLPVLRS